MRAVLTLLAVLLLGGCGGPSEETVDDLLRTQMTAAEPDRRQGAAEELAGFGTDALPRLHHHLRTSEDLRLAHLVLEHLRRIGDPSSGPVLAEVAGDRARAMPIRLAAMMVLDALDGAGQERALLALLEADEPGVAPQAARILARADPRPALELVLARIRDGNPDTRVTYLAALPAFADVDGAEDAIVELLRTMIADHDPQTGNAARILVDLDTPRAWAALRGLVDEVDRPRRIRIAEAIAALPTRDGDDGLALALLEDPAHEVRRAVAPAWLAERDDAAAAVPILIGHLEREDHVGKRIACRVLGRIGDPRAVPALLGACEDPAGAVRAAALVALARIGDRRALPQIEQALLDGDPDVAVAALAASTRFDWSPPRATLERLASEGPAKVRRYAAALLAGGEDGNGEPSAVEDR